MRSGLSSRLLCPPPLDNFPDPGVGWERAMLHGLTIHSVCVWPSLDMPTGYPVTAGPHPGSPWYLSQGCWQEGWVGTDISLSGETGAIALALRITAVCPPGGPFASSSVLFFSAGLIMSTQEGTL